MDNNSLTYKTFKNISYRFLGFAWPMLLTLLITPIIVLRLGVKDYGIYIFINTVVSFLSLLDLGVSFAVIKYLSGYNATSDNERARKLISSANSLFLIIGSAGFLISVLISLAGEYFFPNRFSGDSYYLILFTLAGATFFINSINNLYNLIPDAIQRYDISSKINIAYLTTSTLVNLAVVLLGYKLVLIFFVQFLITLVFAFVKRYYALRIFSLASYELGWDSKEIKNCYRYGVAAVINGTASSSLSYLDRLIIPIFIGPAQLTYYSLPGNISARVPGVTDNLSGIIFPVSAGIDSTGDKERLQRLYIRSVRLITVIATAIALSIIYLADPILRYWLSPDFAEKSTSILIILTITNFIIALQSPVNSFFFGLGRLRFSSILSLGMAILNAAALFILLPRWGILGAAWAYLISVLPIFYTIYYCENKYLGLKERSRYYVSIVTKLALTGIIFFFAVKYAVFPLIHNLVMIIILGPISVIIFLVLYRLLGFYEQEDWNDLTTFVFAIKRNLLTKINL